MRWYRPSGTFSERKLRASSLATQRVFAQVDGVTEMIGAGRVDIDKGGFPSASPAMEQYFRVL